MADRVRPTVTLTPEGARNLADWYFQSDPGRWAVGADSGHTLADAVAAAYAAVQSCNDWAAACAAGPAAELAARRTIAEACLAACLAARAASAFAASEHDAVTAHRTARAASELAAVAGAAIADAGLDTASTGQSRVS